MVFDDDVKLQGLYQRYMEEPEEMKKQIVVYICSETFGSFSDLASNQHDDDSAALTQA